MPLGELEKAEMIMAGKNFCLPALFVIIFFSFFLAAFLGWQQGKIEKTERLKSEPVVGFRKILESAEKNSQRILLTPSPAVRLQPTPIPADIGSCREIPILMYHHIADPPPDGAWLYVPRDRFEEHLGYLLQRGYKTVDLPEVVFFLKGKADLPPKPVVLTFDDGYRDFYENAYPLLRAYHFRATIFVITQLMDGPNYLSWSQVRELARSGLITIGDHGLSHQSFASLDEGRLREELLTSQHIIEIQIGVKPDVLAYPYGSDNQRGEKILQEGGFVAAVTNRRGLACAGAPYHLPRISVGNASLSLYGL